MPGTVSFVDVAVVGAGAVGQVAALLLARQGREMALIGPPARVRDGRTVAILASGWALLGELGISNRLARIAAPLATMRLVDDTGSLFRRPPSEFHAAEIGLGEFGWNVELAALAEALEQAVAEDARVVRHEAVVEEIDLAGALATLRLAGGGAVAARLVVGADGRNSAVRKAAGIAAREWRYPQVALTTIVRHTRPHRDVSTEFHTRSGPCTTVPLPGRRSSIVWLVRAEEGERLAALDDAALGRAIEERTHSILGATSVDGPRGLVPMAGLSADSLAGTRAVLAGEAAHVFPPIGAQGLNLGLRDAAGLAEAVAGAPDPGAPDIVAAYASARAADVGVRIGAVDLLNRSLLADFLPVDLARGAGLLALDLFGPLRRQVMRRGMAGAAPASR